MLKAFEEIEDRRVQRMGCCFLVFHVVLHCLLVELVNLIFGLQRIVFVQPFRSRDLEAQKVQSVPLLVDFPVFFVQLRLISRFKEQVKEGRLLLLVELFGVAVKEGALVIVERHLG